MKTSILRDKAFSFSLPSACAQCNTRTGVFKKIPPQALPSSAVRANYTPSSSDSSVIKDLISCSDDAIRALKAELHDLESCISRICTFNSFHRSLLSPIRKLPNETLSEIFSYVVCGEAIDVGIREGPIWNLLQVCAHWRNIVQNTPSLWNTFKLRKMEISTATIILRVRLCLEFSRAMQLSIVFLPSFRRESISRLIEDIAKHSGHLLSLAIYTDILLEAERTPSVYNTIQVHNGLPNLKTLLIKSRSQWDTSCLFHYFRNPSALEEVKLKRISLSFDSKFPWTNVKRLTISWCQSMDDRTEMEFLSILPTMTQLEELTWVSNLLYLEPQDPPSQIALLPSLHTLNISWSHTTYIWSILSVPKLANLRIRCDSQTIDGILNMIRRSSSVIKRLHLDPSFTHSRVEDILTQLREVEELSLSSYDSDNAMELIGILNWNAATRASRILPYLQKLEFRLERQVDPEVIPLLAFIIESRSPTAKGESQKTSYPTPLKFIKCIPKPGGFPPENYDSALAHIKSAGDEYGVEVEVGLIEPEKEEEGDEDEDDDEENDYEEGSGEEQSEEDGEWDSEGEDNEDSDDDSEVWW